MNFIEKILKIRKTDSNFQLRTINVQFHLLASYLESRLKRGFEIQLVSYEKYLHRSSDREWRIKYHLFRTKNIYIDCDPQNSRLRLEDSNFHIRLRILSSRVRGRIETETRIRNTISFVRKIFTSIL